MFVFQVGAQKSAPQEGQLFKPEVRSVTGKEMQRMLQQGVMPVCELMLSRVHNKPDAF